MLVSKIHKFDYIVTKNEMEALLLEDNLIKRHRPQYNIALKDDKKYPYIKITLNREFPTVFITRQLNQDGSKYFGPYTDVRSLSNTVELLEKIFKLRTCKRKITRDMVKNKIYDKPCLNFQINKCDAPCIANISYENYRKKIKQVILFLRGKNSLVRNQLEEEMKKEASKNHFEKAAEYRDQIKRIIKLKNKQVVNKYNFEDMDVIGIGREEKICCAVLFKIREGKLIRKGHYFLENTEGEKNSSILNRFLTHSANWWIHEDKAPKLLVQEKPTDKKLLEKLLSAKIFIPQRGDKKKLVEMAKRNAFLYVEEKKLSHLKTSQRTVFAVKILKDELHLSKLPRKIAAFDVSNLFGSEAVASMVFFDNGKPRKNQYRRFKIKTVQGINDYLMMEEVITRYLSHLEEDKFERPDLILIDGGKGQLNYALKALSKYSYKIYLFSLAKGLEEVFTPGRKEPIVIPRTSYALKLLQKLRDEAHRFAITYHKKLRDKKTSSSQLDQIPGIGEKRKFELLKYFISIEKIKKASIQELASLPGISDKLAKVILKKLNKKGNE